MLEKWKELLALAAAAEQEVAAELPRIEEEYQRALERLNVSRDRLKYYSRLRTAAAEMTAFLEAEERRVNAPPSETANLDKTCSDVSSQEGAP